MNFVSVKWSRMRDSALARNSLWMFLGQGLSVVCQACYFVLVGRLLGTREYGVYVGAVALVSIVSQYSTLGSQSVLLRYVSADSKDYRFYWGNVVVTTLVMGSLFVVLLTLFGPSFAKSYSAAMLFNVALADCICAQLTLAVGRVFQAFERMAYTAAVSLLVNFLRALLAGYLLLTHHRGSAFEWSAFVLGVSIAATLLSLLLVTRLCGSPKFSPRLLRDRAGEGVIFALSYSTTGIYNDVDKAIMGHNGMNVANGLYTMAYRVVDVGTMPVLSIQNAAFPGYFQRGTRGIRATRDYCFTLVRKTAPLALVISAALFFSAPLIPRLLGRDFSDSVIALRWLCILPLLRSFQLAAGDAVTGAGFQKLRLAAQASVAVLNLVGNLIMIPRYSWRGAAWVSVATDGLLALFNWIVMLYLGRRAGSEVPDVQDLTSTTA